MSVKLALWMYNTLQVDVLVSISMHMKLIIDERVYMLNAPVSSSMPVKLILLMHKILTIPVSSSMPV